MLALACDNDLVNHRHEMLGPDEVAPLRQPFDGVCWWCRAAPAATGEHKFKRTDLSVLMGDRKELVWGSGDGRRRDLRGHGALKRDRHGVIKFMKSLCAVCNNARSRPFDIAYEPFADYLRRHPPRLFPGVALHRVYGDEWAASSLNLARYYAKHFGCRCVRAGVPVPESLRAFLDGAEDIPDGHMAIITTDTVRKSYASGLSISPDFVWLDEGRTRITGAVFATYVGALGVRFEWHEEWTESGKPPNWGSQFFHYPNPVINRFRNEMAVFEADTRSLGLLSTLLQKINQPRK